MGSSKESNAKRIFEAVSEIDAQDNRAKKRRQSKASDIQRSKAAQSQSQLSTILLEVRILLQRSLTANTTTNEKAVDCCNTLLGKLREVQEKLDPQLAEKESVEARFESSKKQWETVLNRRHSEVKLHSGKMTQKSFKALDASFWSQVEATVQYEEAREDEQEFSDSKLYQQLLKDFCTSNSAALSSNTSNDVVQRRKASNDPKKKVDRRASKGRKIRYATIDKLVNFTFPIPRPATGTLNDEAYFKSLFGGAAYRSGN